MNDSNFKTMLKQNSVFLIGCIVFFALFGMQMAKKYALYRSTGIIQFSRLSLHDKLSVWDKNTYPFAVYCRRLLHGRYSGQLITDLDIAGSHKHMLMHRKLRYFLYPVVHIRPDEKNPDCIIVFKKNNPRSSVPADFEIVGVYDNNSLVAIRKD